MKNKIILFLLFGQILFLHNAIHAGKGSKTVWKLSSGLKLMAETPMGKVYQFKLSDQAPWKYADEKNLTTYLSGKINSLEFELPDLKKCIKFPYMTVEFSIRVFPAESKVKNPNLHIAVGLSGIKNSNVKTYANLVWLDELHSGSTSSGYIFKKCNRCSVCGLGKTKPPVNYIGAASKTPYYGAEKYRFVFSPQGKTDSISLLCIHCKKIKQIYRFVIFIPKPPTTSSGLDKETPREIIEISEPSIKFSEKHPDDVEETSSQNGKKKIMNRVDVQPVAYPYDQYELPEKSILKLKNPDHIYACALKLLDYDPPQAQDIFENLANGKSRHVLAMYQAGFGYWRGIGIKPDREKALHFFKKAAVYGLTKAFAAYQMMNLESIPIEQRMGLSLSGKGFLKEIRSICVPKYGTELSFLIRMLRLDNASCLKPADSSDLKNQLMEAIDKNGRLVIDALKFYPQLSKSAGYNLAAGLDDIGDKNEKINFFTLGAKQGNTECELELMKIKVKQQKMKPSDFTDDTDLKFADYPLYYILKDTVQDQKSAQINDLLNAKKNLESYKNSFNAACVILYNFYTKDFRNSKSKLFLGKLGGRIQSNYLSAHITEFTGNGIGLFGNSAVPVKLLIAANKKLENAASKGNMNAIYLLALQYLKGKRLKQNSKIIQTPIAKNLFFKAAQKGHLKAEFMLIKLNFENNNLAQKKWLAQLKKFRKMNYGPAWLLSARIFEKIHKNYPKYRTKIMKVYMKAAALGENDANFYLGNFIYQSSKIKRLVEIKKGKIVSTNKNLCKKILRYWNIFKENDCKKRDLDVFDYYSSSDI